ncbi:MAG: exodeoxyribonuclease VII large subunit, partial [Silicimonas sp.]|nr:exodeoxyribonuclease VII large subunit [Silicimonas sp.]
GYQATLERGYSVVRAKGQVITAAAEAEAAKSLEIEFRDGRVKASTGKPPEQGTLF